MGVETVSDASVSLTIRFTVSAGRETSALVASPDMSGLTTMLSLWFSRASCTSCSTSPALTVALAALSCAGICAGALAALSAEGALGRFMIGRSFDTVEVALIWNSTEL